MSSVWVACRKVKRGIRFRVMYGLGGRESASRYAGAFPTIREALIRKQWVAGELAAMRVPNVKLLSSVLLAVE